MSASNLGHALEHYSAALTALEEAERLPSPRQILTVLGARDEIHTALAQKSSVSTENLAELMQLDSRLKQKAAQIAKSVPLADWRASFQPPTEAWWWFIEAPEDKQSRFNWIWTAVTILCLTISLGLVTDITSRFFTGGPDTWAALAIVFQSALALLAAGGALTTAGQEAVKRVLTSLNVPTPLWQGAKLTVAMLLLGLILILRFSLPSIAIQYNNRGLQKYYAGYLTSAQFDYMRAIKLNPDFVEAHYNLGLLYEDLQQIDNAQTEYAIAAQGGLDAAYNNLARLYILKKDYAAAVTLLRKGLLLTTSDDVTYDLHKNLAWARLEQARYDEALVELKAAVALAPDRAPAHCILAQVLENQKKTDEARVEWETCLKLADSLRADEDLWIGLARQHLVEDSP